MAPPPTLFTGPTVEEHEEPNDVSSTFTRVVPGRRKIVSIFFFFCIPVALYELQQLCEEKHEVMLTHCKYSVRKSQRGRGQFIS